jgi:hypothetical protein
MLFVGITIGGGDGCHKSVDVAHCRSSPLSWPGGVRARNGSFGQAPSIASQLPAEKSSEFV